MPVPDTLVAPAPAKLNLVLEVTGRREDGYHELDSVLQTLELADLVTVSLGGASGVTVSGPFADGTPADESNLAWRAAAELAERIGRTTDGLGIGLEKHIPPAGGLGGGASDAATVLTLLRRCWPEATGDDLLAVANEIGSDEAFFLTGGTARARGRGEQVEALPPLGRHAVVLFVPPQTIERKTARMFEALDRLPFDTSAVSAAFARRAPGQFTSADAYNAFERVAFDVFDGLFVLWEDLETRVGDAVRLAGAGPTLFWIGALREGRAVAELTAGSACQVILTATAGAS